MTVVWLALANLEASNAFLSCSALTSFWSIWSFVSWGCYFTQLNLLYFRVSFEDSTWSQSFISWCEFLRCSSNFSAKLSYCCCFNTALRRCLFLVGRPCSAFSGTLVCCLLLQGRSFNLARRSCKLVWVGDCVSYLYTELSVKVVCILIVIWF